MIARRSGEVWTAEEDEKLRQAALYLCEELGRTWAGVRARIERLSTTNWHVHWPENRPAPSAFQVLQEPESAFAFLREQLGGRTVSMTDAAKVYQSLGLPRPHAVLIIEQLDKKGWVRIEPTSRTQRTVTIPGFTEQKS